MVARAEPITDPATSRYYRVMANAVADLEHNTADTRRALYEKARIAFAQWIET